MTYRLLTEIKVRTSQGETVLPPGKIIRLDQAKASILIDKGKIKPLDVHHSHDRRETENP
jgi:hypothetical protein